MDTEEINRHLHAAMVMRPPRFQVGDGALPPRTKITMLEDYMVEALHMRAELIECRHWLNAVIETMKDKIADLTGYEAALPSKPAARITRDDRLAAKRTVMPQLFIAGAEARRLHASVCDQIDRLDSEQTVLSRLYTVIVGG